MALISDTLSVARGTLSIPVAPFAQRGQDVPAPRAAMFVQPLQIPARVFFLNK
jgi:hypothetical protein